MIDIRPETDLVKNFDSIKQTVKSGNPVCLTENGYGSMIILSYEQYAILSGDAEYQEYVEAMLDEADAYALSTDARMTAEEVFGGIRRLLNEG